MTVEAIAPPRAQGGERIHLSWFDRLKYRVRAKAAGRLANSRSLSDLLGLVLLAASRLPGVSAKRRLEMLAVACRRATTSSTRERLRRAVAPYLYGDSAHTWRTHRIGWARYYGDFGQLRERQSLTKTLVLKAPGPGGEKGVLFCPFEYNWMRLIVHHDAKAILSEYTLVGASSASPTDFAALANLAGLSEDPVFVAISNLDDIEAFQVLSPTIEPVPILYSDWIDPGLYTPRPHAEREIDILMVANWLRVKRHWLLFEALRDMPRDLRVVLIGRNAPPRTEREIRTEAKAFGVRQDIQYLTNIPIQEVADLQSNARISAVFSYREGSCVAVAESLFADSPVAMMCDAHVGAKAYINPQTGVLLRRKNIARQLSKFLERSAAFSARAWADANLGSYHASARLNRILRENALRRGRSWTTNIAPFSLRYVPVYFDPEDEARMTPASEELERNHGVVLEKFVYCP